MGRPRRASRKRLSSTAYYEDDGEEGLRPDDEEEFEAFEWKILTQKKSIVDCV